nr:DNA topoisomerase 2 [Tanacetum cinerariifolium]
GLGLVRWAGYDPTYCLFDEDTRGRLTRMPGEGCKGGSAEAFARCGVSVVGEVYYGMFPLRCKLPNVKRKSLEKLEKKAEIQNIKKILGLEDGKTYENVKELRYGHLMIMADQDHDGSHFKRLLINFLHSFWPSLP